MTQEINAKNKLVELYKVKHCSDCFSNITQLVCLCFHSYITEGFMNKAFKLDHSNGLLSSFCALN